MNPRIDNFVRAAAVAALAAAAAFSAGCASQKVGGGVRPGPDIPGEMPSELTKADADLLAASVAVATESDDAAALAARVKSAAEAALVGNGFKVSGVKPDVLVAMTVRQTAFDKSGNYCLLEGSVPTAKVVLPEEDAKVVAVTQFPAVRGERVLGMDRAAASLGDNMVPAIEKWVADTVKPANFDMAAVSVVIKRNTLFYKSKDPIYVNRVAETVARIKGVYSCRLVAGDAAERLWEFRIVYRQSAFPGGLLNKIIEVCSNLDVELNR